MQVPVLAITSAKRSRLLPEAPTVEEASGIKSFEVNSYYGVVAPKGTPQLTIEPLHGKIVKAINSPSCRQYLETIGADAPIGDTNAKMATYLISA